MPAAGAHHGVCAGGDALGYPKIGKPAQIVHLEQTMGGALHLVKVPSDVETGTDLDRARARARANDVDAGQDLLLPSNDWGVTALG